MTLRTAIQDLLRGPSADEFELSDGSTANVRSALARQGFGDLPAAAFGVALVSYADSAAIHEADALAPIVTALGPVPEVSPFFVEDAEMPDAMALFDAHAPQLDLVAFDEEFDGGTDDLYDLDEAFGSGAVDHHDDLDSEIGPSDAHATSDPTPGDDTSHAALEISDVSSPEGGHAVEHDLFHDADAADDGHDPFHDLFDDSNHDDAGVHHFVEDHDDDLIGHDPADLDFDI